MTNQLKWKFSNYDYHGFYNCPACEAIKSNDYYAIHPEIVSLLCEKHLKEFKEWHDKEVLLGNIETWFN